MMSPVSSGLAAASKSIAEASLLHGNSLAVGL